MSVSAIGSGNGVIAALRPTGQETAGHPPPQDPQNTPRRKAGPARTDPANSAQRPAVSTRSLVSSEMNAIMLQQQQVAASGTGEDPVMNTNKGYRELDLDAYFSDNPEVKGDLRDVPFLLPSPDNITAISEHVSERLKQVMAKHGLPAAPEQITYDNEGRMQLPPDYPYAEDFKQALQDNPGLDRELRTVNALTSHYVEIQKSAPFREEYAAARTQAEAEAIISKYSYLFNDNRQSSSIALEFSEDGDLRPAADGKPVNFA